MGYEFNWDESLKVEIRYDYIDLFLKAKYWFEIGFS